MEVIEYKECAKEINRNITTKIKFISDGDVAGAIYAGIEEFKVDIYLGVGGAPEGVLAAAAIKCLGGQVF